MNTKLLKQRILDLAIHGRLVPQNSDDEPASQLLRRISEEKEKLIAQGKIKRPKKSDAVNPAQECPFQIPNSWEWVKLGEICTKFSTGPFGSMLHKSDYTTNGIPVINPANIINGIIALAKAMNITNEKAQELSKYILYEDDILLARRGDLSKCAIVTKESAGCLCGTGSFAMHLCLVNTIYFQILYNTQYIQNILIAASVGATMDNLNQNVLSKILIPLPPLAEQQRIVSAIEKWFSLIDEIETNKESLQAAIKQTKSKVLDLAIKGKLVKKTDEWKTCALKDVCSFSNGYAFSSGDYKKEGTPLIRISNIQQQNVDLTDAVCVQGNYAEQFVVKKGDLLIAMSGATTGKMGVYQYDVKAYLNQRVGNIRIRDIKVLHPLFRNYFLQSKSAYILKMAYGGAQPNISANMILNLEIPLPPLSEQTRIVSKIEEIFGLLDGIEKELE